MNNNPLTIIKALITKLQELYFAKHKDWQ